MTSWWLTRVYDIISVSPVKTDPNSFLYLMYIDVNNINSNRKTVMSNKQNTPLHNIDTSKKYQNFTRLPQQKYHNLLSIVFLTIKFSINIAKRYKL